MKVVNMNIEKIYFDMDGVLADFDNGVRTLCQMEPLPQNTKRPKGYDEILWKKISKVEHFYDKLEPMRGAKKMIEFCIEKFGVEKVEILTGIPKPRRNVLTAKEDKEAWVKRNLSDKIKVNTVFREDKINFAKNNRCILVDDYEKNIKEWENAGGYGILFIDSEDVIRKLKNMENTSGSSYSIIDSMRTGYFDYPEELSEEYGFKCRQSGNTTIVCTSPDTIELDGKQFVGEFVYNDDEFHHLELYPVLEISDNHQIKQKAISEQLHICEQIIKKIGNRMGQYQIDIIKMESKDTSSETEYALLIKEHPFFTEMYELLEDSSMTNEEIVNFVIHIEDAIEKYKDII